MKSFVTILLFFVPSLLEVGANCGCGTASFSPSSYDYGGKSGVVVRPFDLPKVNLAALTKPRYVIKQIPSLLPAEPLKPSGDLCSCKATVVSPALVPKPAFAGLRFDATSKILQKLQAAMAASYSTQSYSAQSAPAVVLPPATNYAPATSPGYLPQLPAYFSGMTARVDPVPIPSDPVSLQLALKAQREAVKSLEDKLSFGFRSLPIDAAMKKATAFKTDVPEENLLALNGAVVALQPPRTVEMQGAVQIKNNVDDEAEDSLTKSENLEIVPAGKKPTLGEIGFAPANIVPPPTFALPPSPPPAYHPHAVVAYPGTSSSSVIHTAVPATYGVPGAPSLPCNEIYPGQVQMGVAPKREKYVLPAPPPPPCEEGAPLVAAPYSYAASSGYSSGGGQGTVKESGCGCGQ